jgi:hypothetical protein
VGKYSTNFPIRAGGVDTVFVLTITYRKTITAMGITPMVTNFITGTAEIVVAN